MKVKVKMLRTLGVGLGVKPDRVEGETYDVPEDEADALVDAGLAEKVVVTRQAAESKEPAKKEVSNK